MPEADWKNVLMKIVHQMIIDGHALITDSLCGLTEAEADQVINAYKEYCNEQYRKNSSPRDGSKKGRFEGGGKTKAA